MRILNLIALVTFVTAGTAAAQPSSPGRGMDMNAFMERCAVLRQQPGSSQSRQGRQALEQCDQMDRSMGMTPPGRR